MFMAGAILMSAFSYEGPPVAIIFTASLLLVASLLPIIVWLRRPGRFVIPILAIYCSYYAFSSAIPAMFPVPNAAAKFVASDSETLIALGAALLSVAVTTAGYGIARFIPAGRAPSAFLVNDQALDRLVCVVVYPISALLDASSSLFELGLVSQVLANLHRFFFVWALYCFLARRLGTNTSRWIAFIVIPIDAMFTVNLASGFLYTILVYVQIVVLCVYATRNRIAFMPIIVGAAIFGLLAPAKPIYRELTWNQANPPGVIEGSVLFAKIALGVWAGTRNDSDLVNTTIARIDARTVTAAIVAGTADNQFEYGKTYLPLIVKLVPRPLWPDKPEEDLGNSWARQYGLLDADDFATSYNLPWLPEMYLNFGWLGIVMVSGIVGVLMNLITRQLATLPTTPARYALSMLIGSAFFWPESNLSLMLGGALIASLVALIALTLINSFVARDTLRRRTRREHLQR